jgi:hypothetical protein
MAKACIKLNRQDFKFIIKYSLTIRRRRHQKVKFHTVTEIAIHAKLITATVLPIIKSFSEPENGSMSFERLWVPPTASISISGEGSSEDEGSLRETMTIE